MVETTITDGLKDCQTKVFRFGFILECAWVYAHEY